MKALTEQPNPKTTDIDRQSTIEIVRAINAEDKTVADAVSMVLSEIAKAVDVISDRLSRGGRLLYAGAGTSGRLGVLDASECPPTFGVSPDLVQGIIAAGDIDVRSAVEGAEDDSAQAAKDLEARRLSEKDVVVGISASGDTPYSLGALEYARRLGAFSISLTCNPASRMAAASHLSISPVVGPEAITGSSRMKAGTAQKMILNMLSTATMVKLGFVYGNLMSNLSATNEKLRRRALSILREETGLDAESAARLFGESGDDLKLALLMAKGKLTLERARELLEQHSGSVRRALDDCAVE